MSDFTNSAKRVLNLVTKASQGNMQHSTVRVWAGVLGIDAEKAERDPHEVSVKLQSVREEIDIIDHKMRDTNFPERIVVPYLSKLRNAVSVTNLGATWNTYVGNLGADTFLALEYWTVILESEEPISIDELQKILSSTYELRTQIESANVSRGMRELLLRQLSIIERAIQDYPIRGEKAITKCFHDAATVYAAATTTADTKEEKEKDIEVKKIFGWVGTTAKTVTESDRVVRAVAEYHLKGDKAIEHINETLKIGN